MQSKNIPQRNIVRLSSPSIACFLSLFTKYKNSFLLFFPSQCSFSFIPQTNLHFDPSHDHHYKYCSSNQSTFCKERIILLMRVHFGIDVRTQKSIFHIPPDHRSLSAIALIFWVLRDSKSVLLPFEVHLYIDGKEALIFRYCPNNPPPLMSKCRKGPKEWRRGSSRGSLMETNSLLLLF